MRSYTYPRILNLGALVVYLIVTSCALVGPVLCFAADHVRLELSKPNAQFPLSGGKGECGHAEKNSEGIRAEVETCRDVSVVVPTSHLFPDFVSNAGTCVMNAGPLPPWLSSIPVAQREDLPPANLLHSALSRTIAPLLRSVVLLV